MQEDVIDFQILSDGTIKVVTSGISGVNHRNADELLSLVARLAGGETKIEKLAKRGHAHHQHRSHVHQGGKQ